MCVNVHVIITTDPNVQCQTCPTVPLQLLSYWLVFVCAVSDMIGVVIKYVLGSVKHKQ